MFKYIYIYIYSFRVAMFPHFTTVKREFDSKIISSCDIKSVAVVIFLIRGAERGVAVEARPTILHLGLTL